MTVTETNTTSYAERAARIRASGQTYLWTGERDAAKHGGGAASHPISEEVVQSVLAQDEAGKRLVAEQDARFRAEGLRPRDGHTKLGKAIEFVVNLKK